MNPCILVIAGPTASGKKKLAVEAAKRFGGEIISADSRKVYRYLDIGTAKPSVEDRQKVAHHLIDIVDPDEPFSAGEWVRLAGDAVKKVIEKGKIPVISGGTGFYIKAFHEGLSEGISPDMELREMMEARFKGKENMELWKELHEKDPERASELSPNDRVRVMRALEINLITGMKFSQFGTLKKPVGSGYNYYFVGTFMERGELYRRINKRVDMMIKEGLLDEINNVLGMGYSRDIVSLDTVGYKEWFQFLDGVRSFEECLDDVKRNTRRYAKRQMTWFRAVDDIKWVDALVQGEVEGMFDNVEEWLSNSE